MQAIYGAGTTAEPPPSVASPHVDTACGSAPETVADDVLEDPGFLVPGHFPQSKETLCTETPLPGPPVPAPIISPSPSPVDTSVNSEKTSLKEPKVPTSDEGEMPSLTEYKHEGYACRGCSVSLNPNRKIIHQAF